VHFAAKVVILPWALGSVADLMGPPGALEGTIQKSLVKKRFFGYKLGVRTSRWPWAAKKRFCGIQKYQ
jgi:hypothetical protein